MWVRATAQLSENVYQVTNPISSHMIVCGEQIGIVDSGIAAFGDSLSRQLSELMSDGAALDYIFLTHCHFDHLGGVPALRKAAPKARLVTSSQAAEKLSDGAFLEELYKKNLSIKEAFSDSEVCSEQEWKSAFTVDRVVNDGDTIEMGGGLIIKVFACPGHTSEQVAYFVPSDGALAGAEAFGAYYGRDKVVPSFGSSFKDYIDSLERVTRLEVKIIGLPHNGALSGDLAQKFLITSRLEAERFFTSIKERLTSGELLDEIVLSVLPDWRIDNICPEGPFVAEQEKSLRDLVEAVVRDKPSQEN